MSRGPRGNDFSEVIKIMRVRFTRIACDNVYLLLFLRLATMLKKTLGLQLGNLQLAYNFTTWAYNWSSLPKQNCLSVLILAKTMVDYSTNAAEQCVAMTLTSQVDNNLKND